MDGCFAAHPSGEIIPGSFGRFYVFQHAICPFHIGSVGDRRAAVCFKSYGIRRLRLTADGETVFRPAAKASRAADRHLRCLCGIKPGIVRRKGIRIYIIFIGYGIVRAFLQNGKHLRIGPVGKPCQLLFASVEQAIFKPGKAQKSVFIAVSKIVFPADTAFAVCINVMVEPFSVDGAAAEGHIFLRNTRQVLFVQAVINAVVIGLLLVLLCMAQGFYGAVRDLDFDIQPFAVAVFSDTGNISAGAARAQGAAFGDHITVFNDDLQRCVAGRMIARTDCRAHPVSGGIYRAVCNADPCVFSK